MNTRQPGVPAVPGLVNLAVLARGGHATVYRATQVNAFRDVAVKVENGTLEDEKDQRRFIREARAASKMSSHPHVVDLYDVGVTEAGHPFMIMELCRGNYAARMKHDRLGPTEARSIGAKIADALAGAHTEGVLHRDVKPENILVTQFGEPVLADFGLAVLSEAREVSMTIEMTPAYAAPELFGGGRAVPASDVYALCATLYALMLGRPPRWRDNLNPSLATLMDLFAQRIPDLPGVPPEFSELLRRGMHNDPARRPTAASLRDELRGVHRDPDPTMVLRRMPGQPGPGEDPTQPTVRV
jgi:serine/threonine protein kinase